MNEVSINNCWHCDKSLLNIDMTDQRFKEIPFHCSRECQEKCKRWNYKPKPFSDKEWYDKSLCGQVIEDEEYEPFSRDDYQCPHKYNCANHRDVCMGQHGYSAF